MLLSEVCEFRRGLTYSKRDEVETSSNAVLRATNVSLETGELDLSDIRYISDKIAVPVSKKIAPGTLLVCTASGSKQHLGKTAIVDKEYDFAFGGFMGLMVPHPVLLPKFLFWMTRSEAYWSFIGSLSDGASINNLKFSQLGQFRFWLPPLEEQKRIVGILDEAFEGLVRARENALANLETASNLFLGVLGDVFDNRSNRWETNENFFSSLRSASVNDGKRTKRFTQTGGREATTRKIVGHKSLSVLAPSVVPRSGWRWTKLTDLARLESGHTPSRKHPEYWGGDVPWLAIKDARNHHGHEVFETIECTNQLGIENSSARVLPKGTVCLSRTASVGYVVVMGRDMATSQDFVNWVCGDDLSPDFLKFLLLAQGEDILKFASGSVHQTIYFPEVKAFHICHPPRVVQDGICKFLEEVRTETIALVERSEVKLRYLDQLKKSLLHKAFSGQLT